jgi:hypothetical protein
MKDGLRAAMTSENRSVVVGASLIKDDMMRKENVKRGLV